MARTLTLALKEWGDLLSQGLVITLAPEIAKGMIVGIFEAKKVSVKGASDWVQSNTSLWKTLEPDEQALFKDLVQRVGNIDWLDADWVIDAIKSDFPAVASLFLGWRKANNWLKRQCELIRNEIRGGAIPKSEPKEKRNPEVQSEQLP